MNFCNNFEVGAIFFGQQVLACSGGGIRTTTELEGAETTSGN